jgi:sarcosine oxidase gamma subunit
MDVDDHGMAALLEVGSGVMTIFGRAAAVIARQADINSFVLILH